MRDMDSCLVTGLETSGLELRWNSGTPGSFGKNAISGGGRERERERERQRESSKKTSIKLIAGTTEPT